MSAREERERLLAAMVGVYLDAGAEAGTTPDGGGEATSLAEGLGAAEEEMVGAVRAALETIAVAVSGETAGSATSAALGGAELTTRALVMAGEAERLPALLPGFAYLVTLPGLGEPEAARLAGRVREVVARGEDEEEDTGEEG